VTTRTRPAAQVSREPHAAKTHRLLWTLLVAGSVASLAANVAVAEPTWSSGVSRRPGSSTYLPRITPRRHDNAALPSSFR